MKLSVIQFSRGSTFEQSFETFCYSIGHFARRCGKEFYRKERIKRFTNIS